MEPISDADLETVTGGNNVGDMFKQALGNLLGNLTTSLGQSLGGGIGQLITNLLGSLFQQGGTQMAQLGQGQGQDQGDPAQPQGPQGRQPQGRQPPMRA
jgi:hypothetical protein